MSSDGWPTVDDTDATILQNSPDAPVVPEGPFREEPGEPLTRPHDAQPVAASANGSTAGAPARRSSRPATVIVQRESTRSSTSSTGPGAAPRASARTGGTTNRSHTSRTRNAEFTDADARPAPGASASDPR